MTPAPFWPRGPPAFRQRTFAPDFSRLPPESNRLSLGSRYSSASTLCQEVLPPPLFSCLQIGPSNRFNTPQNHADTSPQPHACMNSNTYSPGPPQRPVSLHSYNRLDQTPFLTCDLRNTANTSLLPFPSSATLPPLHSERPPLLVHRFPSPP
jgi:hypothetical protein